MPTIPCGRRYRSLTSCGTSDPVTPQGTPTITAVIDPTAGYSKPSTQTYFKFEKGDRIKVRVNATVPGGVQIFNITKGSSSTQLTYSPLVAAGAASINQVIEIPVTEDFNATTPANNVITVNFNVKNSQATALTVAKFQYEVTAQGQGGGGGAALLLRASANVNMGSQLSTLPSYAASQALSTGSTLGLYSTTQAGAATMAQKQSIDLTFGVANANDDNAGLGAAATRPRLISPTARTGAAGNLFNNPMGADARNTTFKTTTLTEANLTAMTASGVNNIDHSTGATQFVNIAAGSVYSFVNQQGAKGYVLIKTLTGAGDNRDANITVVVQQLQ